MHNYEREVRERHKVNKNTGRPGCPSTRSVRECKRRIMDNGSVSGTLGITTTRKNDKDDVKEQEIRYAYILA